MALASIVRKDGFEVALVRSNDEGAGKARQLVDMNGSYRTRTLDMNGMGSNADVNNLGLLTMLGNTKTLNMCGVAVSYDDIRTREQQIKIDIVRAFGSEVAQMGAFIKEVMAALGADSNLTPEQKDNLFTMVTDIVSLKNMMNLGVLPEGQARLEAMIAETANAIAEKLLDGMDNKSLSTAIVDFVHGMLSDVHEKYDIPDLDNKMAKIEGRMNPEQYLADATTDMIAQLTTMLEGDDLSDEAKAEIESLIEQMQNALDNGEPIPRDVMKSLEALGDKFPDLAISQEFTASLEVLKDANIVMKAEMLGISVDQMQSIEFTIETLNIQLQDASPQAKAEIESMILSMQDFADKGIPLDKATLKALDGFAENFPEITSSQSFFTKLTSFVAAPFVNVPSAPPVFTPRVYRDGITPSSLPVGGGMATPITPVNINGSPTGNGGGVGEPSNPTNPSSPPIIVLPPDAPPVSPPVVDPVQPPPSQPAPKPEGDKLEAPEPDKATPQPQVEPKLDKPDTPTGKDGCEGVCLCDRFKEAGKYSQDGDNILYKNEDGTVVKLSKEEAYQRIENEITKGYEVNRQEWQKLVDTYDGDMLKAREHVKQEIAIDQNNNRVIVAKLGGEDITNQGNDDALRRKIEEMRNLRQETAPTAPSSGESGVTGPFTHVCDSKCNHGTSVVKGYIAGQLGVNAGNDASAEDQTQPQRTGFKGRVKPRQ